MYTDSNNRNFDEVNHQHQQEQDFNGQSKYDYPQFNRPMGLRWRDDQRMMEYFMSNGPVETVPVMPILTEHPPASPFGRGPSTERPTTSSRYEYSSPSLEDIDLIDVLWRSDIAGEKGTRQVAPADQYECDLQTLTEKSTVAPLTAEENARYEDLSKGFYNGFFESFNNNQYQQKHQQQQREQIKTPTLEHPTQKAELEDDLFDEDLAQLFEDVSREEGQLNQLFDNKQQHPVINNVSLSEGIVYNQANLTEMQEMRDSCNQVSISTIPTTSTAQPETLFNVTDSQTVEQWLPTEVVPNDVFPTSNYAYIGMQNDSLQAVVSNGQIDYDHSYQSTGQTPLSPLIIGSSGRQQQTQTSPGSVTVTATATQSLFDPYHSQRHSFSDCTTDSSSTCSRLSSESPRYTSESSTGTHESRFYGKLAPSSGSRYQRSSSPRSSQSSIKIARVVPLASGQRKRGRQSKDEQLASDNELPVSAFQISEMSLSELQQVLKNESLSEYQRQLIRKIRRRGKNKVAARTCRQRRTDRHDKMSHYI
ncbi:Protein skinhead-1 [Caenorhabditis elegans]|nr:Protein skinhead-1 [Caenorhabditis elegans]CCD62214.1 Protein skinhead-1 [Caenorhabditis elegans]|eukprot:NP_741405.1 Protein skinhead-1 [Caenorhabditis elegans]